MLKLLATLAVLSLAAPHHTEAQGTAAIRQQRLELDRTVWSDERRAQQYEAVFVSLWDRLRAAQDARPVLAAFPFNQLLLGSPQDSVNTTGTSSQRTMATRRARLTKGSGQLCSNNGQARTSFSNNPNGTTSNSSRLRTAQPVL